MTSCRRPHTSLPVGGDRHAGGAPSGKMHVWFWGRAHPAVWVLTGPGPGLHPFQAVRTPSAWVPALPTRGFSPAASPAWVSCFGKTGARAPGPPSPAMGMECGSGWEAAGRLPATQQPVLPSPQIQKWGNIEWAHDYELQELRARTAAGTLFVHLCSESTTVKHKLLQP